MTIARRMQQREPAYNQSMDDPAQPSARPLTPSITPLITGVLETILYAEDLHAIDAFYAGVLGLPRISGDGTLAFGYRVSPDAVLLVFKPSVSNQPGRGIPAHGLVGPGHIAFRIDDETYDPWLARLEAAGVAIEQQQTWPMERKPDQPATGRSIYCRDPAGNSIELITADIWPGVP
jgi:catechol 2,3-dioxygenase-like lactoylglutathione lyase family enzyme